MTIEIEPPQAELLLPPHQSSVRISSRIVNHPACPCRTIFTTYRPRDRRNSGPISALTELDKYTRLFEYRKKKKSPGARRCSFATAPQDVRQFAKFASGMVKVHHLQRRQVRAQAAIDFCSFFYYSVAHSPKIWERLSFRKMRWVEIGLIYS